MERFETVGVIRNEPEFDEAKLDEFMKGIEALRERVEIKKILLNYTLVFCLNFRIKKQANT